MKKIGSVSAAIALATTLAACSQEEAEQNINDAQSTAVEVAEDASSAVAGDDNADDTASVEASGSDKADDTASQDNAAAGAGRDAEGAQSARSTALDVLAEAGVEGGVVTTQDWDDDGGWEIDVVAGDTIHEVKVKDGEVVERENDEVDDADRAAASASTSIDDAISAALESVPGELDEASFEDGQWKVEIDTGEDDDVEVRVDAETGEVLS